MAKDGVKKGFFFYFGLFLLIILGVVSILFIVMMFMPKTSILGLQYFTNHSAIRVDATTDEAKTQINFDAPNFSSVVINSNFASVYVQKNNEFERNGIYFVNNSKGFVSSKKANNFEYKAIIEDGVLKISVTEEQAFLYFSKDVRIVFQISNETINPLSNKHLSINTSSGNVYIGGTYVAGHSHSLLLGGVEIETSKGSINFSTLAPNNYPYLYLKTRSGDINIGLPSLRADEALFIETTNGDISATKIESPNTISIASNRGKISISDINANVNFKVVDAYIQIANVIGNVDFAYSVGKFNAAVVKINRVDGDFNATDAKSTYFELGSVQGKAVIETGSGNIVIKKTIFTNWQLKTESGKIQAEINTDATNVNISTQKGRLEVTLPNNFSAITIENQSGITNLNIPNKGKYKITFKYYESGDDFKLEDFKFDNVNLNLDVEKTNPMLLEQGGSNQSTLTLKCNKQINFNWKQSA